MLSRAPLRLLVLLAVVSGAAGCAVRSTYVKPDFATVERNNLKRVAVVATPLSGFPPRAAELLASMSRRFINQHKDYLALSHGVIKSAAAWKQACKDGVHGVVRVVTNRIKQDATELDVDLVADLRRCDSGVLVWKVEIRDTNDKQDDDLSKLAAVYKQEFGAVAEQCAAPFFVVVQAAFQSLPSPKLTDEETMEKISMDE